MHDVSRGSFGGFRSCLEAAAKLATAEGEICITGPVGSGKRKLAEAIVEARGDNSSITSIENKAILKEMNVDHAILIHLVKFNESLIRGSEIIKLPPIHKRPWDIVPLVIHNLQGTPIKFITYNALDYFIRDIWLGNIPQIERLVRNTARKAGERGSNIISFDDIRECIPIRYSENTIEKCNYIIQQREHLDEEYVPFTAYSSGPIELDIGRFEIAGYLFAVTFFKKGNRTIMANFDANTPNPNLYHGLPFPECSPPYKFEELLTKIELYEPPKCRSADMLSLHWLKDEQEGRKYADKIVEFSRGDKIFFDVAKMQKYFEKIIDIKIEEMTTDSKYMTNVDQDAPPQKKGECSIDPTLPKWLTERQINLRDGIIQSLTRYIEKYRSENPGDPYAQELRNRTNPTDRDRLENHALEHWNRESPRKSTIKLNYLYPRRVKEYGAYLKRLAAS